jgi:O-antigen/teichoic acid export membrane protein
LDRTTAASLTFFWITAGALLLGAILLGCLAQPLSRLFCGANFQSTALFVPSFAAVMVPLGLLQALGIFSLASRRHHECFVLGGCAVGYALLLYFAGRQPQLMAAYMFGGGLVSLMVVLFVGVARWGRKQP